MVRLLKVKSLINTLQFVLHHPLTQNERVEALRRFFFWQVGCRLIKMPIVIPWVNQTRLLIEKGMAGATGNYYCGLHEFNDMSFVLHYLRPKELFLDIGANVGTYSVLAAGCVGAQVIAIEPIPKTYRHLMDNININGLHALVDARNIGLDSNKGQLDFSADLDAENHVVASSENSPHNTISVEVSTLDEELDGRCPKMIKIDVEGFETEVLKGGAKTFASAELEAVLIELNGAGLRYGFSEKDIHEQFERWGFSPCRYDPYSRLLDQMNIVDINRGGNVLFLKDIADARKRLEAAKAFNVLGKVV